MKIYYHFFIVFLTILFEFDLLSDLIELPLIGDILLWGYLIFMGFIALLLIRFGMKDEPDFKKNSKMEKFFSKTILSSLVCLLIISLNFFNICKHKHFEIWNTIVISCYAILFVYVFFYIVSYLFEKPLKLNRTKKWTDIIFHILILAIIISSLKIVLLIV